ncbi:MAG: Na+/H+ antiporter NhaA [Cyclobacteriaceae bacterium]
MATEKGLKKELVDRLIVDPSRRFISNSSASGMVLFSAALLALIVSNSPFAEEYHHLWKVQFSVGFDQYVISKDLHHWINDGLMAVFFFVVGLELKREIIGGELSDIRSATLPIVAALGGMLVPAGIYLLINKSGAASDGWGIPMATDIAFSLGVLSLIKSKVPLSLKIFLTALAIADDIGAVLVIAFFYSSEISMLSLVTGLGFMIALLVANRIGVRSTIFYALFGIGGLWLAFLMSGVHATIAAVLAAFTIPARTKVDELYFGAYMERLSVRFKQADPNNVRIHTKEQLQILQEMRSYSKMAITPLQRLEENMHPFVSYVIMPLFAFSNAGVTFSGDFLSNLLSPVALGIIVGLLLGKVVGVVGITSAVMKLTSIKLPEGMKTMHLWGVGFLAAVGFTMSLFISGLAFKQEGLIAQAKIGTLVASIIASVPGYVLISRASVPQQAAESE